MLQLVSTMNIKISFAKVLFFFTKLSKRIWVRAFLYALLGIVTAIFALFVRDIIPEELSRKISTKAVGNILTILASSMLAVATFSISIMVVAFGNVSSNATPRATKLIIENQSAQRAVATFIGAFLYSIVGIIALATNSYGDSGRFVLFLVTIIVVIVIVMTLIEWVDQLSSLGQVGSTITEIEKATLIAIKEHTKEPYLGGLRLEIDSVSSDSGNINITSDNVGFVVLIDTKKIQKICEDQDIKISIVALPGSFVSPGRPLAKVPSNTDKNCIKSIASLFVIENHRNFKSDPRFGFTLLSEIGSRALSKGVNDPGTALEVLGCATRLLKIRSDLNRRGDLNSPHNTYSRVFVRPVEAKELIASIFAPIIRDGASIFEVGVTIQKYLRSLNNYDPEYKAACDFYSDFTKLHFDSTLKTQYEKDLVAKAWGSID